MTPNRISPYRESVKEAAAEVLKAISNAADSASKVIVQSAADAARVLTATAADAAKVVSAAAAVSAKVMDEKTGTDHESILTIGLGVASIEKAIVRMEAGSIVLAQRVVDLESSRRSLNQLISIGIGILTLETGLIVWHLFKTGP
jgi:hypothetical protein